MLQSCQYMYRKHQPRFGEREAGKERGDRERGREGKKVIIYKEPQGRKHRAAGPSLSVHARVEQA